MDCILQTPPELDVCETTLGCNPHGGCYRVPQPNGAVCIDGGYGTCNGQSLAVCNTELPPQPCQTVGDCQQSPHACVETVCLPIPETPDAFCSNVYLAEGTPCNQAQPLVVNGECSGVDQMCHEV